ncbi:MAG: PBP1A family penicillin-binding protein [Rhodospirillales bacterium]|nr:PBP1A family penicillin-binding protein [Rhodospirillales bacterium]
MASRGRTTQGRREPRFDRESGGDDAQGETLRADPDARARVSKAPAREKRAKKTKAPRRSAGLLGAAAGFVFRWGFVAGIWAGIAAAAVLAVFWFTLPPIDAINRFERRPSLVFVDGGGETVATYGDLYGGLVKLDDMPPWLPMAVLATEDRRFYTHMGIDPQGLARATLANLRAGRVVQGGSTITQQLAKNVFLSSDRSFKRKIQEMLLAFRLEHAFSKDEILTIYLNRVYLGAGTYGVEAAARRYFGKSARDVNAHEAAVIAGLLKAPSRYAPTASVERAKARAGEVLDNMVEAGFMTAAQRGAAARLPLAAAGATVAQRGSRYFTDWLAEQVQGFVGYQTQDLVVVTTMNPRLQRVAEAALDDILAREGQKASVEQGAFVLMRPDGAVEAMVGGRDYAKSAFNRAVDARRQPGSAFKAFVYLAAAEQGLRPDESVADGPLQIQNWKPRNFDSKVFGEISVRDAFARSVNTSAVRIAQRAGVDAIVREARTLGISSPIPRNLSIALGTADVNLLELTGAYAAFANGGDGVLPYAIVEIRDPGGRVLYRRQGSGPGRVISPGALSVMQDLLQAVVRQGTGRAAALDRPAGGKTGTTNDYRDAWFVGFTADHVAGAWFGNDDATEMERTTGGSLPARLWKAVMIEAEKGLPARALPGTQPPEEQGWFARLLSSFPAGGGNPAPQDAARPVAPAAGNYDFASDPILRANQNR